MTKRRREEVRRIRAEGRAAAINNVPSHRNPYQHGGCDWSQWLTGYDEGQREIAPEDPCLCHIGQKTR